METIILTVAIIALDKILVPMDKWHWDSHDERRSFLKRYVLGMIMVVVAFIIAVIINTMFTPLSEIVPPEYQGPWMYR